MPTPEEIRKKLQERLKGLTSSFSTRREPSREPIQDMWATHEIISTPDGLLAAGPGELGFRFGIAEWRKWLNGTVGGFEDNIPAENGSDLENAAIMMKSLADGVSWMHSQHVARGRKEFERPHLYVMVIGEEAIGSDIGYWKSQKVIAVKKTLLQVGSREYRMDTVEEVPGFIDLKTVFIGTVPQWLQSVGVEECDHAEYNQFGNPTGAAMNIRTQAQYDAQPPELRALKEQRVFGASHGFLPQEMQLLDRRITVAEHIAS